MRTAIRRIIDRWFPAPQPAPEDSDVQLARAIYRYAEERHVRLPFLHEQRPVGLHIQSDTDTGQTLVIVAYPGSPLSIKEAAKEIRDADYPRDPSAGPKPAMAVFPDGPVTPTSLLDNEG